MTFETYTLFLSDLRSNCSVYSGNFNSIESARRLGELVFNISIKPSRLVVSSQQFDISDDVTFVPGMIPRTNDGGETLGVAEIDRANDKEVLVAIQGQQATIKQREKSMGWKFADLTGAAYKWEVQDKERGWELHDRQGELVATFNGNQFWHCGYANFAIREGVSEDLRILALISWALCAKSVFAKKPAGGSKSKTTATTLEAFSYMPVQRSHDYYFPDLY